MTARSIATQMALIGVAVVGIGLAYEAIEHLKKVAKDRRLAYIKERDGGMATFTLPQGKENRDLTKEEKAFKSIIAAFKTSNISLSYAGMSESLLEGDAGQFFSFLPFYSMGKQLGHPIANRTMLDKQRRAVSIFLDASMPDYLSKIDSYLQTEWKSTSFFSSTWHRENYLNDLRAARCLMMLLANVLWNLQHPVDAKTGYPLTTAECITLCRDFSFYLESLIESANPKTNKPPYLYALTGGKPYLLSYIRKINIYTKALHAAYVNEQLHQLNIDDVTNSAHQILEMMDTGIISLIYKRRDPWTNEPDNGAASDIASTVEYLCNLFYRNDKLMDMFLPYQKNNAAEMLANVPPITVIDALIIFCHMTKVERRQLLAELRKNSVDSTLELAETLEEFNQNFIRPVERISRKELKLPGEKRRSTAQALQMAAHAARRFIPFMTLILADLEVKVDTPKMLQQAGIDSDDATTDAGGTEVGTQIYCGQQQITRINAMAASKTQGAYYQWGLLPFIGHDPVVANSLDDIIIGQNRITQVVHHLDTIKEVIKNYKHFLQREEFQKFLLAALGHVKEEYAELKKKVGVLDNALAESETTALSLKVILANMDKDMAEQMTTLNTAMSQFERVVNSPHFVEQQRQMQDHLIETLDRQYQTLWSQESGLRGLLSNAPPIPTVSSMPSTTAKSSSINPVVSSDKIVALSHLAHDCLKSMSYISWYGYKGILLRNLIARIDKQPQFTDAQFNIAIKELLQIALSYRETYFFQAAYGQTATAKQVIKKIRDPHFAIPLGTLLFGAAKGKNYSQMSQSEIIKQFQALRARERWQETTLHVHPMTGFA